MEWVFTFVSVAVVCMVALVAQIGDDAIKPIKKKKKPEEIRGEEEKTVSCGNIARLKKRCKMRSC